MQATPILHFAAAGTKTPACSGPSTPCAVASTAQAGGGGREQASETRSDAARLSGHPEGDGCDDYLHPRQTELKPYRGSAVPEALSPWPSCRRANLPRSGFTAPGVQNDRPRGYLLLKLQPQNLIECLVVLDGNKSRPIPVTAKMPFRSQARDATRNRPIG